MKQTNLEAMVERLDLFSDCCSFYKYNHMMTTTFNETVKIIVYFYSFFCKSNAVLDAPTFINTKPPPPLSPQHR